MPLCLVLKMTSATDKHKGVNSAASQMRGTENSAGPWKLGLGCKVFGINT